MKPVLVLAVPSFFLNIPERKKAASHMVEHTVDDHTDPCVVELFHKLLKVLIGSEPRIDLFVISGVVAVSIGFKDRRKINRTNVAFRKVRNKGFDLSDPVRQHPVILIRRAGHPQRVELVKNGFICPHLNLPPVSFI